MSTRRGGEADQSDVDIDVDVNTDTMFGTRPIRSQPSSPAWTIAYVNWIGMPTSSFGYAYAVD
jgi:hypothetical protein